MNYKKYILSRLLNSYENSDWLKKGFSNRRVIDKPGNDKILQYMNLSVSDKQDYLQALSELKKEEILDFSWMKYSEDNIVDRIWLNTEIKSLETAYQFIEEEPPLFRNQAVVNCFSEKIGNSNTIWLKEVHDNLVEELKIKKGQLKLGLDEQKAKDLALVLADLDKRNGISISRRILSVQLFRDSKYFEQSVESNLISLLKKYSSFITNYGDTTNEILAKIGITSNPEVFHFSGEGTIYFNSGEAVSFDQFSSGFTLIANNLSNIREIDISKVSQFISIENLTSYYAFFNEKTDPQFIFYTGGFLTQNQQDLLMNKLKYSSEMTFHHWGDIDLGGMMIFEQMKEIFPSVQPKMMDVETYNKFVSRRKKISKDYLRKVEKYLSSGKHPEFSLVLKRILAEEEILEQEAVL